jgi:hypothetical protein
MIGLSAAEAQADKLPAGWEAIEVDRLWVRGQPMRLVAQQGQMATLTPLLTPN